MEHTCKVFKNFQDVKIQIQKYHEYIQKNNALDKDMETIPFTRYYMKEFTKIAKFYD